MALSTAAVAAGAGAVGRLPAGAAAGVESSFSFILGYPNHGRYEFSPPQRTRFGPDAPARRPGRRRRAFLVGVALPGLPPFDAEEHLAELAALADTAGVEVVGETIQARKSLDPKFFIGSGKAAEVAAKAAELRRTW